MYVYFDRNGTIKEVINDLSIRRGSVEANKIYVYVEDTEIDDIWFVARKPDGTLTTEQSFITHTVEKSIPYDAKRDMYYFKDFETYNFYVYTLTSSELSEAGLMIATIRIVQDDTIFALGELTFNVQENVIKVDNNITQSQYDYLLLSFSSLNTLVHTFDDRLESLETTIVNKADRNNSSQTIVAGTVSAGTVSGGTSKANTIAYNEAHPYRNSQIQTYFTEEFIGSGDSSETYMVKKFTIPRVTDSNSTSYGWNTQKAFIQFNDNGNGNSDYGTNNTTGLGFGINTTNGVKPDIQIIPAFKYAQNYSYYASNPLDPLILLRPSLMISPFGIFPMGNMYSSFGFYTDPYDNTKKAIYFRTYDTNLRVTTNGVEVSGTDKHIYDNGKQVATQEYVDGEIDTVESTIASLEDTTGASIDLILDSTNYKITAVLKNSDGTTISTSTAIDLPLESVVVSGAYDDTTKKVVLTLQNGSTIEFSVADLVSGLQTEITAQNKLDADFVDDTNATHKFVNASEKAQITTNATNITALKNGTDDTNVINYSRTINQSFTSITHLSYDVVMSQANFDKINKNTIIVYNIYSSVDNVSLEFYLRVKNAYVVVENNEAQYGWNFEGTYGLETGDGLFTMQFTVSPSSLNNCDVDLYLTQTYTRDDINNQFLTDAEMTALLSEVFN